MTETDDERAPRIVSFDLMPDEPDYYFVLTEALGEFAARHRGEAEDKADPRMSTRLAETAEKALDLIEEAMSRGRENLHGKPERRRT